MHIDVSQIVGGPRGMMDRLDKLKSSISYS